MMENFDRYEEFDKFVNIVLCGFIKKLRVFYY